MRPCASIHGCQVSAGRPHPPRNSLRVSRRGSWRPVVMPLTVLREMLQLDASDRTDWPVKRRRSSNSTLNLATSSTSTTRAVSRSSSAARGPTTGSMTSPRKREGILSWTRSRPCGARPRTRASARKKRKAWDRDDLVNHVHGQARPPGALRRSCCSHCANSSATQDPWIGSCPKRLPPGRLRSQSATTRAASPSRTTPQSTHQQSARMSLCGIKTVHIVEKSRCKKLE